jgi:hypothetical protein
MAPRRVSPCTESSTVDASLRCTRVPRQSPTLLPPIAFFDPVDPFQEHALAGLHRLPLRRRPAAIAQLLLWSQLTGSGRLVATPASRDTTWASWAWSWPSVDPRGGSTLSALPTEFAMFTEGDIRGQAVAAARRLTAQSRDGETTA